MHAGRWLAAALGVLAPCCADGTAAESERPQLENTPAQAVAASAPADSRRVTTTAGALRGREVEGVEQFLGVPYAAPPLGELRFAPPAPVQPWTGERDATQPGPVCLQPVAATGGIGGSESCLTLNVYRPATRASSEPLPVAVWLHGGSFQTGAGSLYDPRRLVLAGELLVVTINYRLGALGFLAHSPSSAEANDGLSGNYGLLDQQAALRWVQDNIAAFGGDPRRVTLQGQSAGGASVCAQLASPSAAGLFSGAIIQSASCASAPLALAEAQGAAIASAVGCSQAEGRASCLRALPAEQLAAAGAAGLYGPATGGAALPRAPAAVVAEGAQLRVPVLIGGVRDEMRGFFGGEYPLAAADYLDRLATYYPNRPAPEIAALYPLEAYPEPFDALSAALSDGGAYLAGSLGGCVTAALADAFAATTPTYAYEFDDHGFVWAPGLSPVPLPVGASHSSELVYLFDGLDFLLKEVLGPSQQALAQQMVAAWTAFIRTGAPGSAGTATWPRYDVAQRRMLRLEPEGVRATEDFRERHHCDYWQTPPGPSPAAPSEPAEPGEPAVAEPDPAAPAVAGALTPLDLTDPALDPDLAFLAQDGLESIHFADTCRSVAADGASVEEEPLPVGGGSVLQCATAPMQRRATQLVLSSTNALHCVLGAMDTIGAGGDDRLVVSLGDTPEGAPWVLTGTREGEPITISRVVALGGSAWPLWVESHYGVVSIVPNPEGLLCDEVFGL